MSVHVLLSSAVTAARAWQDAERAMTWLGVEAMRYCSG